MDGEDFPDVQPDFSFLNYIHLGYGQAFFCSAKKYLM